MPFPAGAKKPESPRRYDQSVVVCIGADLTFWPVPEFAPPSGHFLDQSDTAAISPVLNRDRDTVE